ncbi:lipopolysaccharide assembly protein LapB [Gracilinema caldarium]|uniref:tetratricopeptide repeat protein n=1 Tax=Gracilinema caldarium TaxID=215591 RepID=UPI0026F0E8BF|nr:tetratricopeptide repeat protein [Gracilinema caldarium]
MKLDPLLTKAARYVHRGQYGKAIRLLEPEVVRYHDSHRFYYILAVSCLYAGDYGGAHTYFRRCRELKMQDPNTLLGLAVLHVRRGETDRAVELYLEVLDLEAGRAHPSKKAIGLAKRGLTVIRKHGEKEALSAWLESGSLKKLFPPLPPVPRSLLSGIQITLGVISVFALTIALGIYTKVLPNPFSRLSKQMRPGLESLILNESELKAPVKTTGSFRYVLTQDQVLKSYELAKRRFTEFRDEAAKVEINRILESNASDSIKTKANLLLSYTVIPGFNTLKDFYSYIEVQKDPYLYRNVVVRWKGMAANIQQSDRSVSFDLLVGYDLKTVLQGIVPVVLPFATTINQDAPIEVLGSVVIQGEGQLALRGIAIHQPVALPKAEDQ